MDFHFRFYLFSHITVSKEKSFKPTNIPFCKTRWFAIYFRFLMGPLWLAFCPQFKNKKNPCPAHLLQSLNVSVRWRSLGPAGSATITSSLLCLKITLYKTNSPSYHHLWQPSCLPYCWPCRHRNCHWFLSGRCAGQRVMWHTIEVGSPGQRPPSAAPHGAFLSFPPTPPTYTPTLPPYLPL